MIRYALVLVLLLTWNQQGPDLAAVAAYTYTVVTDGAATIALGGVVCTPFTPPDTADYTCSVTLPALPTGTTSITLTAANSFGESAPSAPLVLTPTTPTALRVDGGSE